MGRRTPSSDAGRADPYRPRARLRLLLGLAAAFSILPTACKPNKRYDLIEAELRTRDKELADTRAALEQSRVLNRAYEQGRGGPPLPGAPPTSPATAGPTCSVKDITLGRGTGGLDDDGCPGDEALMVVIVPRDEDGSAVKVPGKAQVAAWEVAPSGIKTPIGSWDVPAEKLRPTWRGGIFSTGYFVTLPWQTFPTGDRVRVAVRLTTTDGRMYEADRDITVRPVAGGQPRMPQPGLPPYNPVNPPFGGREPLLPGPAPPGVPSVLPPGTEELPPPAGLVPDRGARLMPPVKY